MNFTILSLHFISHHNQITDVLLIKILYMFIEKYAIIAKNIVYCLSINSS